AASRPVSGSITRPPVRTRSLTLTPATVDQTVDERMPPGTPRRARPTRGSERAGPQDVLVEGQAEARPVRQNQVAVLDPGGFGEQRLSPRDEADDLAVRNGRDGLAQHLGRQVVHHLAAVARGQVSDREETGEAQVLVDHHD